MDKDSAYWLSCNAQHSLTFVIYLLKHRNPGIALPLLFRLGGILSRRPSPPMIMADRPEHGTMLWHPASGRRADRERFARC